MAEITVTVPAQKEYVLVLRTALGGVALVKDLSVDALDDLRMAVDEACDLLLHQKRPAQTLRMEVNDEGDALTVSFLAQLSDCSGESCQFSMEISRAVLETLMPRVEFTVQSCGCVERVDMTMPKAAV